jgi:hypothetical protein
MTPDATLIVAVAICIVCFALQVVAYHYRGRSGLALATALPFALNTGIVVAMYASFKLCVPRGPGCEMAGFGLPVTAVLVFGVTALLLLSGIVIDAVGRLLGRNSRGQ